MIDPQRLCRKPVVRDYRDLWSALLLTLAAVYFLGGFLTPVQFERERIQVRVEAARIHVTGQYLYRNTSFLPAVLTLAVPFPVDTKHPVPDGFALGEVDENGRWLTDVAAAVNGENVRFRLMFRPGEAKWVRLDYSQKAFASNGRYLLMTTRAWRRPIERAEFSLRLSPGLELRGSNFELERIQREGSASHYAFSRQQFWPHDDWRFTWSVANQTATWKVEVK
jgi:hypothetical protein